MKKNIKVLGPGCPKCKTTYNNVLEAVKQMGIEADVRKIEDIEELEEKEALVIDMLKIKSSVMSFSFVSRPFLPLLEHIFCLFQNVKY